MPRIPGSAVRIASSAALLLAAVAALAAITPARAATPPFDHVVVVMMENKSYDQVRTQPFTMSLMAQGATFTNSFGVTHPSQPNYIAFWAAGLLGVTNNNCPAPGSPFFAPNLGQASEAAGLTWRAYSENLAVAGSAACSYDGSASSGLYTRKHAPWTQFANLNHANERPYTDLAADLAGGTLPNLAFVVPSNCHNSHNSPTVGCTVPDADAWLAANLPPILTGMGPNGVLILTWDEDDNISGNHVLTVFFGSRVLPGAISTQTVTHYTVTRAICDMLGIAPFALARGEAPITDIWTQPVAARTGSWGRLKSHYR